MTPLRSWRALIIGLLTVASGACNDSAGDDADDRSTQTDTTAAVADQPHVSDELYRAHGIRATDEVVARRSLDSYTFARPTGDYVTLISTLPLNYESRAGTWVPISTRIRQSETTTRRLFAFENTTNALESYFPADPREGVLVSDRQRTMRWVPLQVARGVVGEADGEVMRYAGAYPDAVEEYRVGRGELKHDIILDRPPASASFRGKLLLTPGRTVFANGVEQPGAFETRGAIELRDDHGGVFVLEPVYVYEKARPRAKVAGRYEMTIEDGQRVLAMAAPEQWLYDPARVYPVVIDPTVGLGAVAGTAILVSNRAACATGGGDPAFRLSSDLRIGFRDQGGTNNDQCYRSSLRFATGQIPDGSLVTQVDVDASNAANFGAVNDLDFSQLAGPDTVIGTADDDPVTMTDAQLYADLAPGSDDYATLVNPGPSGGGFFGPITLGGTANADLAANLPRDFFAVGVHGGDHVAEFGPGSGTNRYVVLDAEGNVDEPTLTVTYTPPPIVTSIVPSAGRNDGPTSVTITGSNFTGATSVTIDGTALTSMSVDTSSQITGTVPAGIAPGSHPVIVSKPGLDSSLSTVDFLVYAFGLPTVTGVTPPFGDTTTSTPIVIAGTNFTGATGVTINGTALAFAVNTDIQISATVPAGIARGSYPIIVTTGFGNSAADTVNFTVTEDTSEQYTVACAAGIPDNDPGGVDCVINVTGSLSVEDLRVHVDISHTYVGDLVVTLTSPLATTVVLSERYGRAWDDIKSWYDLDVGTAGNLADFDGELSTGAWTLNVSDNAAVDTGTVNEVRLGINQVPDLVIETPDVSFDNPAPADGDPVVITAVVHNYSPYDYREPALAAPINQAAITSLVFLDASQSLAQSFRPAVGMTASGVEIELSSDTDASAAMFNVRIETDAGGLPSGTAVSSTTSFAASQMAGWQLVTFADPAVLTAATDYWIVASTTSGDANFWTRSDGAYAGGTCAFNLGAGWNVCTGPSASEDQRFRLHGRTTFARFYDGDPDTNLDDIPLNNGETASQRASSGLTRTTFSMPAPPLPACPRPPRRSTRSCGRWRRPQSV